MMIYILYETGRNGFSSLAGSRTVREKIQMSSDPGMSHTKDWSDIKGENVRDFRAPATPWRFSRTIMIQNAGLELVRIYATILNHVHTKDDIPNILEKLLAPNSS